ncbi:hypothetical protein WJX81_002833 [Elliptochloris bilobata]|uniref:Uncharacterized protein n=1 Tax=Elliptochloris bilobata TaxID=381761 RepID=A0AAW1S9N0_9CHLO
MVPAAGSQKAMPGYTCATSAPAVPGLEVAYVDSAGKQQAWECGDRVEECGSGMDLEPCQQRSGHLAWKLLMVAAPAAVRFRNVAVKLSCGMTPTGGGGGGEGGGGGAGGGDGGGGGGLPGKKISCFM